MAATLAGIVVVGAAIMGRLTLDRLGLLALLIPGVAGGLALWVFFESRARYDQHLDRRQRRRPRGGRAALSLAVGTSLIALTEVLAIMAQ